MTFSSQAGRASFRCAGWGPDMVRQPVLAAVWLLALVLATTTASAQSWQGATYEAVVARVVDGDTIHVQA